MQHAKKHITPVITKPHSPLLPREGTGVSSPAEKSSRFEYIMHHAKKHITPVITKPYSPLLPREGPGVSSPAQKSSRFEYIMQHAKKHITPVITKPYSPLLPREGPGVSSPAQKSSRFEYIMQHAKKHITPVITKPHSPLLLREGPGVSSPAEKSSRFEYIMQNAEKHITKVITKPHSPLFPREGPGVSSLTTMKKNRKPRKPRSSRKLKPGTAYARENRQKQTPAEQQFWEKVRNRRFLNKKFTRQFVIRYPKQNLEIGFYIADFYCHEKRLVVEIDGGIHLKPEQIIYDDLREKHLQKLGYNIIRFTNEEVLKNWPEVSKQLESIFSS
jgi:very-short-patch-repair endonuclease